MSSRRILLSSGAMISTSSSGKRSFRRSAFSRLTTSLAHPPRWHRRKCLGQEAPRDRGHPSHGFWRQGKHFVERLLDQEIDVAYAYQPREGVRFPHAFMNTALYLDYHRDRGFPYTMLPISVNCYGRKVIADRGFRPNFGNDAPLDPPSPSPRRCMQLGAAVARIAAEGSQRVALVASAGWSHANLTDATWRMRPDVDSDRVLFDALQDKDYALWHGYTTADIERAGQQEVLNWFCLLGAMEEDSE